MTSDSSSAATPTVPLVSALRPALVARFGTSALGVADFDALLHHAAAAAAEGMGILRAKVLEYRPDSDDLLVRAGVNWKPGVVGRATLPSTLRSPPGFAFRTGEAVAIANLPSQDGFEHSGLLVDHGVVALLNVPVRTDSTIWGVLEVDSSTTHEFTQEQIHFLQGLANVLGAAIRRLRAETALQAHAARLQMLSDTAADLLAAENPDAVLQRLFAATAGKFGVDAGFSYLASDDGGFLDPGTSFGLPALDRPGLDRLAFGEGLSGTVAQTRQPLYVASVQQSDDPRLQPLRRLGIRAVACHPLLAGDRLLGTLAFASCQRDRFADEERAVFGTLAHYVAVVRDRVRARIELADVNAALERRVEERTRQLVESNRRLRHEIAERENAEAELRRREADYRALYNNAPAPQHTLDADARIVGVSDYWLELLGYTREAVLGRPITEFMTSAAAEHYMARWPEFLARGEERGLELQFVKRCGGVMDVLISGRTERDAAGRVLRSLSVLTDITARRQAERERDRLFEISQDLIVIAGFDGRFRDVNPALERSVGYGIETLRGMSYFDFVHPEDRGKLHEALRQLRDGEAAIRVEVRYRRRDDTWRWTSWRAAAMADAGLVYALGRDVTDRRQTEEALRQAQKMEAVGHLTGGVAHDFNNLLTVMMGNLELLRPYLTDQPRLRRMVDAMQHAAERGERLTAQLLAFSRRQNLQPEVLDPNALIRGFVPLIRRAVGEAVRIETVLSPEVWPCDIDAAQLEAALLNLAVNARDAMPEGGTLTIETRNVLQDGRLVARIAGASAGPYVVVAVCDTGTGMPPEVIERAFEPFFTTKDVGKGTGLGLSQVYGFVEQSGGHVTIDSTPGAGTAIRLYLPPVQQAPAARLLQGAAQPGAEPRRGQERVLLVEDNPDVLRVVSAMLLDLGYDVRTASGPLEALDMLQDGGLPVDLLFSDIVMPQMSGTQLVEAARRLRPTLKVLLTSGYSRESAAAQSALNRLLPVINKPYKQAELAASLRAVLDG